MGSPKGPAMIKWASPPSPSLVLQLIRSEPNIQKALLIFESAASSDPSCHDPSTFALMSSRLASSGLPGPAESLLARSLPLPPSEASFLPLFRAYSRAGLPLLALRLLRRMPSLFLLPPSHLSYNAAISALLSHNLLPLARSLLLEMKSRAVPFSPASFNLLLKALCSSSPAALGPAIRLFRRLPPPLPDPCSYSTLIHALCRHGRLHDARNLFDQMPQRGCSPTVVTFTCLIHGLCRAGRLDHARNLFDEMRRRGVKPNVVTYTSLIDGLCKGGRSAEAAALLERMGRQGCSPNALTYTALVNGLCGEGRLREALEVLDRMRLHGRKPDAGLYGKVIKSLCLCDRYQEAANYLDEMVLGGIVPNRLTWSLHVRIHNMVIRGLCGAGEIIRACQVYLCTRNRGISVEFETYNLLVEFHCKKGDVHKASSIVDEMMIDGCFPDCTAWCSILDAFWARRKVREAAELIWDKLVCGDEDS